MGQKIIAGKLRYDSMDELASDVYLALNGVMAEVQAVRMVYRSVKKVTDEPNTQFYILLMCWNQFASTFFKLDELKRFTFKHFDFFDQQLIDLIESADQEHFLRLRHMQHHIGDIKTNKMFDPVASNEVMNNVFDKFSYLLNGQKSVEFMVLLEKNRDRILLHYPNAWLVHKEKFEKHSTPRLI